MEKVSKKDFYKNIRKIQQNEVNTDQFRFVKAFIDKYRKRTSIEKEKYLFDLIREYKSILESNRNNEDTIAFRNNLNNKLNNLIETLTIDDINNNLYLRILNHVNNTCDDECQVLLSDVKCDETNKKEVPTERKSLLQNQVRLHKKIPYYNPRLYEMEYVNVLDDENLYYYEIYNLVINNVINIYNLIYSLKINSIIEKEELDLFLNDFYVNTSNDKKEYVLKVSKR